MKKRVILKSILVAIVATMLSGCFGPRSLGPDVLSVNEYTI